MPTYVRGWRLAKRLHRRIVYPLAAWLLPSSCFACGAALGRFQRLGGCAGCWSDLCLLEEPRCPGCAHPMPPHTAGSGPAGGRCSACVSDPPTPERVTALVAYDGLARRFLLRAKLGGRPELFEPLGRQLARLLEIDRFAAGCTAAVPVPSHPWVTLRRGFIPARELARPLARRLGLPLVDGLRRRFRTPRTGKTLDARRRWLAAQYAFRGRRIAAGARVLLIDDVMTTGATLEACARALRRAGARSVRAAVWARTIRGARPADSVTFSGRRFDRDSAGWY